MTLQDKEFGEIIIRKNRLSTSIRFSVSPSGRLVVSVPYRTPDFLIKRSINSSRVQIKAQLPLKDPSTQRARDAQKKLLARRAKDYLPYRLEYLAKTHDYKYIKHRLSHAGTRWGSCSSSGTIALNIGLMKLPSPLRDYVILHELAHTRHMNHSTAFWAEVSRTDPNYRRHRKALKLFSPAIS